MRPLDRSAPAPGQEGTVVPLWRRLLIGRNPSVTLVRAAVLALICWVTFSYVLRPIRVMGISMEPTYHDGSVNVVDRTRYLWRKPRRGDVIAIRTTGESIMYLKRIIALPGERIAIRSGTVIIDGDPLPEPYIRNAEPWEMRERTLAADEYFAAGDNRTMPMEQHMGGVIKAWRIVGPIGW